MTTATKELTQDQKNVLSWMDDQNLGAVAFEGRYNFPDHFRKDADLAGRYMAARRAKFYQS